MAMKHRKLFPTSTSNQSVVCPDFCDPTCSYSCYPYSDSEFMPPPPPPPPVSTNQTQHVSPYVIITVTLLSSLFLLVSYYVFIVKYCSGWNPFRRPQPLSDDQNEDFLDENRGPAAIDHPIWFITTVGLQPSVINSITIFKYKKGESLVEGTVCSVCLNEFQDDETLRLLPKCSHAFHIPCVDTWLRSHTNCPLCRAGILLNTSSTPVVSNDQSSNNLSQNEETTIENSETEGVESENEVEFPQVVGEIRGVENSKTDVNSTGSCEISVAGDSDERQPVRRSVSMDSIQDLGIVMQEDRNSRELKIMKSSPPFQSLHKSPVSMKRSFSYAGRSFLSRHYRSPNSILPL